MSFTIASHGIGGGLGGTTYAPALTGTGTNANTIKASIEATIKALTPTMRGGYKFRLHSEDMRRETDDAAASGIDRIFEVWHGAAEVPSDETFDGYHDPNEREVRQEFRVMVAYPLMADLRYLDNMIRSDVHDISRELDDPSNWNDDVLKQRVVAWTEPRPDENAGAFFQILTVMVRYLEATT